jgi:hypothetical protein
MQCDAMRCNAMQGRRRHGVDHAASHFEESSPLPLPWAFPYSIVLHFPTQNITKQNKKGKEKRSAETRWIKNMHSVEDFALPNPMTTGSYPFHAGSPSRGGAVASVGRRAISTGTCPGPSEWGATMGCPSLRRRWARCRMADGLPGMSFATSLIPTAGLRDLGHAGSLRHGYGYGDGDGPWPY